MSFEDRSVQRVKYVQVDGKPGYELLLRDTRSRLNYEESGTVYSFSRNYEGAVSCSFFEDERHGLYVPWFGRGAAGVRKFLGEEPVLIQNRTYLARKYQVSIRLAHATNSDIWWVNGEVPFGIIKHEFYQDERLLFEITLKGFGYADPAPELFTSEELAESRQNCNPAGKY